MRLFVLEKARKNLQNIFQGIVVKVRPANMIDKQRQKQDVLDMLMGA